MPLSTISNGESGLSARNKINAGFAAIDALGAPGSSGTSGISGSSGTSGVSGTSGTSGINGSSGTSGVDGPAGSSGTSGVSGTSGTSPANGGAVVLENNYSLVSSAIGASAGAGEYNVALGKDAKPIDATGFGSVAIGRLARSAWDGGQVSSVAIGYNTRAGGGTGYSVAIGHNAGASDVSIALGKDSVTNGAISIGINANSWIGSVNIGYNTYLNATNNIAILGAGTWNSDYSIAIGYGSNIDSASSVALGPYAKTLTSPYGVAIGNYATASHTASVALGSGIATVVADTTHINRLHIKNLSVYDDNTAALAGGLVAGEVYRTSTGQLMITY